MMKPLRDLRELRESIIYQGHHGDTGASRADVILPGAAYTEKNATYVNSEGRVQRGWRAVFPPGDAREDWTIFRALSEILGQTLPYKDINGVRRRMAEINPVFEQVGVVVPSPWVDFGEDKKVTSEKFVTPIINFYVTDVISRNSETMAKCTKEIFENTTELTK